MSPSAPEYRSESFTVNGEYTPVTGDFNGSGRTDILWYAPGLAPDYIWYFNSDGSYDSQPFTVNGDYIPVTGDFNGSGRTDILWYKPGLGADYIWSFNSDGSYDSQPFTVNGDYIPVTGDFNGSGRTDILWYKPGLGADYIWSFNSDGSYDSQPFTVNGVYTPVEGDFNGDGIDDILWYAPGLPADYIWSFNSDGSYDSQSFTVNGVYEPIPGDFNGSGYTDILWYKPGLGADYLWSFGESSSTPPPTSPPGEPLPPSGSTLAAATELRVLTESGLLRQDSLSESNRNDYYRFTIQENGRLTFNLGEVDEQTGIDLIKDSNNNGVIDSGDGDVLWSGNARSSSNFSLSQDLEAGTYYARIYPYYNSRPNTNYDLRLSYSSRPSTAPSNPGNALDTALDIGTLASDQTRSFTEFIGDTDDTDVYQFTLAENGRLGLNLGNVNERTGIQLIKDFNNNGVIDSGDGDVLWSSNTSPSSNTSLSEDMEAGTYFVQILPYFSSRPNTNYDLRFSYSSRPSTASSNPGNTLDTALEIGTLRAGETESFTEFVGGTDPIDVYQFILNSNREVNLNLSSVNESTRVQLIQDFNNNGAIDSGDVLRSGSATPTSNFSRSEELEAGSYYVQIYPSFSSRNTNYDLRISG